MVNQFTRRSFLGAGIALGGAAALGPIGGLTAEHGHLIETAVGASTGAGASLGDIEHVVILMQENRSFDHYFGTLPGVRGFTDPGTYQSYAGGPTTTAAQSLSQSMVDGSTVLHRLRDGSSTLMPFELTSSFPDADGQTTNDITHDWGPQHLSWDNGAMDGFAVQHLALRLQRRTSSTASRVSAVPDRPAHHGVLPQRRFPLVLPRPGQRLHDLRQLFLLGARAHRPQPPDVDVGKHRGHRPRPGGAANGGPILETYVANRLLKYGTLTWKTMPEVLTDHGVSWKVYQDPTSTVLFNVLPYFASFTKPANATQLANTAAGLTPLYPLGFAADVAADTLPQVSWILPPLANCEHPATPPAWGEYLVAQILETLVSNPDVWAKTVFLVVYDENGGWFDHVAPPTPGPLVTLTNGVAPPAGAAYRGEYVTPAGLQSVYPATSTADSQGVLGPVGLGFRVPALVVSPFSAGGWVCPDVFDHTSTLKLIEKVFLPPGTVLWRRRPRRVALALPGGGR